MLIKLLVEAGDMKPGPAIAQQLGPMGINLGEIISQVNEATKEFKGIQVPVNIEVDPKTKEFEIEVRSPTVSALLKKEIGVEKASGERKKTIVGNLAIEQVIAITKQKYPNMLSKDFLGAVKSIIGSCMSLGILIESKEPKEVLKEIEKGQYGPQIKEQKSEASPEKRKHLEEFFLEVSSHQEEEKKKIEEEKAAEEAKAAAEATAKPAEVKVAKPSAEEDAKKK